MSFAEKLKNLRGKANMTQQDLSVATGISKRMIQQYERGVSQPRFSVAEKLAVALDVPIHDLLDEKETAVATLGDSFGSRTQRNFLKTAEQFSSLMAGGEIPDEDKDAAFMMIMKAYTLAKEKNQVFTPKKYRRDKKNDPDAQ